MDTSVVLLLLVASASHQLCGGENFENLLDHLLPDITGARMPTKNAPSALDSALDVQLSKTDPNVNETSNTSMAETCTPTTLHATHSGQSNPKLGYGVALELLSCVFSNMGLLMEKKALTLEEKRLGNAADVKSYKLPLWWAGFLVFVIGQVISGFALAFVTVVVIAPLGSFSLIVNLFTSYYYAKESTSALQIISSLTIVAGCVLTTAFRTMAQGRKLNGLLSVLHGPGRFPPLLGHHRGHPYVCALDLALLRCPCPKAYIRPGAVAPIRKAKPLAVPGGIRAHGGLDDQRRCRAHAVHGGGVLGEAYPRHMGVLGGPRDLLVPYRRLAASDE